MLRVPTPMRLLAEKGAFNGWAAGDGFPRDRYFTTIDQLLATDVIGPVDDPKWGLLVLVLAHGINEDGDLAQYVSDKKVLEPGDDEEWMKMCTAAAWVVVRGHHKACADGKWPT